MVKLTSISTKLKYLVNEEGIPTDVQMRERGEGERLIESFMLATNETVAEHFNKMEVPFIYRVHEQPKSERLRQFFDFITNFGIMIKGTAKIFILQRYRTFKKKLKDDQNKW